jgi:hypothetical protein
MKNGIKLSEFLHYLNEEDVTFASSTRERKRLTVNFRGGITVTVAGKIIWQGMQPFAAVEAYNAITEKYIDEKINLEL